jgi:hypothetical protein
MKLNGSCHCGAVHFSVQSPHPYPFNLCYCSICRKTAGGGGYAINLGANYSTLEVSGEDKISVFHATTRDKETGIVDESPAERRFCSLCGSALWVWDPRWPELVHPFASAIDTELPVPPQHTHMMLSSKPAWVCFPVAKDDKSFAAYPDESLAEWHRRLGLEDSEGRNRPQEHR